MSTEATSLTARAPDGPSPSPSALDPDVELLAAVLGGAVAGAAVAAVLSTRRAAPAQISMGPGGWVSFRGTRPTGRVRTSRTPRPRWAHLLRARPTGPRAGRRRSHD